MSGLNPKQNCWRQHSGAPLPVGEDEGEALIANITLTSILCQRERRKNSFLE